MCDSKPEKAEHFLKNITDIYLDESIDLRIKYFQLYGIIIEIIESLTNSVQQYFYSDSSKIEYIINEYRISAELANALRSLRQFTNILRKNADRKVSQNIINVTAQTAININKLINGDSSDIISDKILSIETHNIPYQKDVISGNTSDILFAKIINAFEDETTGKKYIKIASEDEVFDLLLSEQWEYLFDSYQDNNSNHNSGMPVNLLNLSVNADGYELNRKSHIILDPSYLFDVTEIAECFLDGGASHILNFISFLLPSGVSFSMLKGNIVNNIFDDLIINPDISFDECYENAIKMKPLSLFALSIQDPSGIRTLNEELKIFYNNIKVYSQNIDRENAIIEPSYISTKWGMQGRLDLLIESPTDKNYKEIVELKSGNFPDKNKGIIQSSGTSNKKIPIGMWNNHYAQVCCYNLLLETVYEERSGNSSIYYARCTNDPSRNAPISDYMTSQIVHLRNQLVYELEQSRGEQFDIKLLNIFKSVDALPKYKVADVVKFQENYLNSSDLAKKYYRSFCTFVLEEVNAQTTKDSAKLRLEYSSNNSVDSSNIISDLQFCEEGSDLEQLHLFFFRSDNPNPELVASDAFRQGDAVVLYKIDDEHYSSSQDDILKCSIKEIDTKHIVLSLRNKLYPKRKFTAEQTKWAIEAEVSSSNNKKLLGNLSQLVYASAEKQDVLLGQSEPRLIKDAASIKYQGLTENQIDVLNSIINSRDYYLLQGPPGTGKTSYILRHAVQYLFENTKENILLLAYTNRAVDEICGVLNKLQYDYLRLGSRDSSIHQDRLLVNMIEKDGIRNVFKSVKGLRIVVSTVYSAINNSEIYDIWKFHTTIVDEASQILEPQIIGALCKTDRFILIGDEKQLPAISIQDSAKSDEIIGEDEELKAMGIENLSGSIFERLLRNANNKAWTKCVGTLTKQARMHEAIQDFPNKYFYASKLEPLNIDNRQKVEFSLFAKGFSDEVVNTVSRNRFVFIDMPRDNARKSNKYEAELVCKIVANYVQYLGDSMSEKSIGIISPFRAQCSLISKMLEEVIPSEQLAKITIDTVERFQGSEREIILYSFALNYSAMLSKIISPVYISGTYVDRKLNVAITRAREQVILLGNSPILSNSPIYKDLIEYSKSSAKYFSIQ